VPVRDDGFSVPTPTFCANGFIDDKETTLGHFIIKTHNVTAETGQPKRHIAIQSGALGALQCCPMRGEAKDVLPRLPTWRRRTAISPSAGPRSPRLRHFAVWRANRRACRTLGREHSESAITSRSDRRVAAAPGSDNRSAVGERGAADVTKSHTLEQILAHLRGRDGHPRKICRVEPMGLAGSDLPAGTGVRQYEVRKCGGLGIVVSGQ
jgi:hypothetical protein